MVLGQKVAKPSLQNNASLQFKVSPLGARSQKIYWSKGFLLKNVADGLKRREHLCIGFGVNRRIM